VVAKRLPLLTEATRWVGHLPIRTRGTIGGSIAHADPSAEYPAVLTALDGEVIARGPKGERVLKPREFFQTYLTTSLAADEILTEVRLPAMSGVAGYAFEEFARRHGDFAIIGIAPVVVRDGSRCSMARLATAGARTWGSPARTWAASTGFVAPARSCSTARPRAPASCSRSRPTAPSCRRSKAWPRTASSTRSSKPSTSTTGSSAAFARRAC